MKTTKTKGNLFFLLAAGTLLAGVAQASVPVVTDVAMTQRDNSRTVDVTYKLTGEAAIVTLAIETNGVALPDSAVTRLSGDVCKVVQPGEDTKHIVWNARGDWPEHMATNAKARVTALSTNAPPPVMVIDLSGGSAAASYQVYYYPSLDALPYGGLTGIVYKTTLLVMKRLSAGHYSMGGYGEGESAGYGYWQGNGVYTDLTQDFYAGVFEVTQEQWYRVMGTDPSNIKGVTLPVEQVAYYQIRENAAENSAIIPNWPATASVGETSFMGKLRTKTGIAGFDLPTEAQWEYACRAGTTSCFNDGASTLPDTAILSTLAWWGGNNTGSTHPVGEKLPNAWGLYDTLGNVWEWCLDWYLTGALTGGANPGGPASGSVNRVVRGGPFNDRWQFCVAGWRGGCYGPSGVANTIGFRTVCNMP